MDSEESYGLWLYLQNDLASPSTKPERAIQGKVSNLGNQSDESKVVYAKAARCLASSAVPHHLTSSYDYYHSDRPSTTDRSISLDIGNSARTRCAYSDRS